MRGKKKLLSIVATATVATTVVMAVPSYKAQAWSWPWKRSTQVKSARKSFSLFDWLKREKPANTGNYKTSYTVYQNAGSLYRPSTTPTSKAGVRVGRTRIFGSLFGRPASAGTKVRASIMPVRRDGNEDEGTRKLTAPIYNGSKIEIIKPGEIRNLVTEPYSNTPQSPKYVCIGSKTFVQHCLDTATNNIKIVANTADKTRDTIQFSSTKYILKARDAMFLIGSLNSDGIPQGADLAQRQTEISVGVIYKGMLQARITQWKPGHISTQILDTMHDDLVDGNGHIDWTKFSDVDVRKLAYTNLWINSDSDINQAKHAREITSLARLEVDGIETVKQVRVKNLSNKALYLVAKY